MQSAADGAASLMTAGFGTDINSGDFLMPADVPQIFKDGVEGAKPVAVGKVAKAITPVPGGVGPMTIACLLSNTVECFKKLN